MPAADRGVSLAAVERLRQLTMAGAYAAALDVLLALAEGARSVRDHTGQPWAVRNYVTSSAQRAAPTLSRLERVVTDELTGRTERTLIVEFATLIGLLKTLPDRAIADPDPQSRTQAPDTDALVVDLMRRLLCGGDDEESRRAAVGWLREVGGPEATAVLRDGLADRSVC